MSEDEEKLRLNEQDKADAVSRRDFLKVLGASFAALAASGCDIRPPKEKIIPHFEEPEGAAPGLARWYASTCGACPAACGVLVKSRDGRPIKMEGNPDHPLSRGGLCARGQASVLDLYDSERLRRPLAKGQDSSWAAVDAAVLAGLARAQREGKAIRLLSQTVASPSLAAAIAGFIHRHPSARHVVYDSLPVSAIREAHRRTHGRSVLPRYRFDRARVIVGFDVDFLGTWISPVEFAKQWAANRQPDPSGREEMSWHGHFESRMSLTGANADLRVPIRPSQVAPTLTALGRLVAGRVGWAGSWPAPAAGAADPVVLGQVAEMLCGAPKRSLVVSGSSDVSAQLLVNWINSMLGNYGVTVDIQRPSLQERGEIGELERLIREMEKGEVGALIVFGSNPAYDNPLGEAFARALPKAGLTAVLSERKDETAALAQVVCPVPHALESWGDAEPALGVYSLFQPVLLPLFDTRPALESLLRWAGKPGSAYDCVRDHWRTEIFPRQKESRIFMAFWDDAVRRGGVETDAADLPAARFDGAALGQIAAGARKSERGSFELAAYPSVALGDGRQANNPWLQELPDPVSRATWGNYASFSPADAKRLGVAEGRVVRLSAGGRKVELPAHVQLGLAEGVVAAALGYGRTGAGKIAANYPMVKMLPVEKELLAGADLYPLSAAATVSVEVLDRVSALAKVQTYDSQTVPFLDAKRPLLRERTLQDYSRDPKAENAAEASEDNGLWPRHEYTGHKWGMAVDLNSCMGCSACVVACQAENNIPVVGKAEVRKSRDMAWIRIDRYFGETPEGASPDTGFQPMLCQHCDNAPCETVCPVLATVHSTEGLNMQVYNRCVGTRYCANNCPYKVRRFNWFDYGHQDLLQNLALNPDITVRTRGVMEKCSFCVQRIGGAKADAKVEGRALKDGDVTPACAQSCPTNALVFGDMNDPNSRVARLAKDNRSYRVLSELGTGPAVFYMMKVRNKKA